MSIRASTLSERERRGKPANRVPNYRGRYTVYLLVSNHIDYSLLLTIKVVLFCDCNRVTTGAATSQKYNLHTLISDDDGWAKLLVVFILSQSLRLFIFYQKWKSSCFVFVVCCLPPSLLCCSSWRNRIITSRRVMKTSTRQMLYTSLLGESVLFSLSLSLVGWIPGYHQERRAARRLCLAHVEGRNRSERRVWRRGKKKSTHPTPTTTVDDIQLLYSLVCVCVYIICSLGGVVGCTIPLFSLFFFFIRDETRREEGIRAIYFHFDLCQVPTIRLPATVCVCVCHSAPPFRPSSPLSSTLATLFFSSF